MGYQLKTRCIEARRARCRCDRVRPKQFGDGAAFLDGRSRHHFVCEFDLGGLLQALAVSEPQPRCPDVLRLNGMVGCP